LFVFAYHYRALSKEVNMSIKSCLAIGLAVLLFSTSWISTAFADPNDSTVYQFSHEIAQPGDQVSFDLSINSVHDMAAFSFLSRFADGAFSSALLDLSGTRSDGLIVFSNQAEVSNGKMVAGVVVYAPPQFVPAGDGAVAHLLLQSSANIPRGSLLPLIFFDETFPGGRQNTISDRLGNPFYADFEHGSILFNIDLPDGSDLPGDINLNAIEFEIADYILMRTQLSSGITSYLDEEQQTTNSDLNYDMFPWTVADLVMMKDVIEGDILPLSSDTSRSIVHAPGDSIWYDEYSGTPVDTMELPIYISNIFPAGGISFGLAYGESDLELASYSLDGSRIEGLWSDITCEEVESGLLFCAVPGAPGEQPDVTLQPGSDLLVTLKLAVLHPNSNLLPLRFERLQTEGRANGYCFFEFPSWWNFASFQQTDREILFSFIVGDADGSGNIDIDDVVYLIAYIFSGGSAPPIFDAGDFDRSGVIDIDDVTGLIGYIFAK